MEVEIEVVDGLDEEADDVDRVDRSEAVARLVVVVVVYLDPGGNRRAKRIQRRGAIQCRTWEGEGGAP